MTTKTMTLMITGAALIGLAACGGDTGSNTGSAASGGGSLAGRYAGDLPDLGVTMEIDFRKDGGAVLTFVEGGQGTDMDCTYQSGESRIALSCFGSSGISLTRLNGGDLEGDIDGEIVRFKKR